jgi:mono/diheme cytochrome c family protein
VLRLSRYRSATLVLVALAIVGFAYLSGLFSPEPRADPADPQQVASGKPLYEIHCASCHGKELEGQPNWQSRLATGFLPAPPHDESGHTWHHPDQILFRIIKAGGAAEAPAGFKSNMPAFSGALRDEQIWAILAYIKSRWPSDIQARQAEIDRRSR